MPIVASVTKRAATATSARVDRRRGRRRVPRRDHAAPRSDVRRHPARRVRARRPSTFPTLRVGLAATTPDPDAVARVAQLVASAKRPVLVAGGDVYWARSRRRAMRAFVETARVPTFVNGMGRGTLPADHELAFSRARSIALKEADLVLVAGTPLDFRLGFGRFGDAQVVHLCDAADRRSRRTPTLAASTAGDLARDVRRAGRSGARRRRRARRLDRTRLRDDEQAKRAAEQPTARGRRRADQARRGSTASCGKRLDRDAIVIGDGGDFVSYAGKYVDSYRAGDVPRSRAVRLPGHGPGYALAAGVAHPGPAGRAAARRRRDRVRARRLRDAGAPRRRT